MKSDILDKIEQLEDASLDLSTLVRDTIALCNDYIEWAEGQINA